MKYFVILCCVLVVCVGLSTQEAIGEKPLVVVLDISGSMMAPHEYYPVKTRCQVNLEIARDYVEDHFSTYSGQSPSCAVITFGGNCGGGIGIQYRTNPLFTNEVTALGVIDGFLMGEGEVCQDVCGSPLAEAMCVATDLFPLEEQENKKMFLGTDGAETNSEGECAGPDSLSDEAPYDEGSWPNKVHNKVEGQVEIDSWLFSGFEEQLRGFGKETGETLQGGLEMSKFFSDIAQLTGGTYTPMPDDPPPTTTTTTTTGVPTLTEWGLIIFITVVMGIGVLVLRRRRMT